MGEKSRDETGRFARGVEDDDMLAAVRAHDPAATSEIAEEVGISRQGADRRLRELRDAGKVSSKKIGASLVWFMPREHGRPSTWGSPDAPSAGESDRSETRAETPATDTGAESADTRPESDTRDDEVRAAIEAVDTPGSGETLQRRREALREMYDYLKEHGTARRRDFEELVDGEEVGYGSFNSFWTNYVKAKDALKQLPNVDAPGEGEHTWRFKHE